MKKEKVTFEELAAGALLKFGKLESADMSLLISEISKFADVELLEDIDFEKYILMSDGSILLNEKFVYNFYSKVMYGNLIDMVRNSVVEKYFSDLNVSDFVLKKINMIGLGFVVKDGLRDIFSKRQLDSVDELYNNGFIEDYMQEDVLYGDYDAVRVTQKGKLKLFFIEYIKEIENFFIKMKNNGIDSEVVEKYFLEQNFDLVTYDEILSEDNFMEFYESYDKVKKKKRK